MTTTDSYLVYRTIRLHCIETKRQPTWCRAANSLRYTFAQMEKRRRAEKKKIKRSAEVCTHGSAKAELLLLCLSRCWAVRFSFIGIGKMPSSVCCVLVWSENVSNVQFIERGTSNGTNGLCQGGWMWVLSDSEFNAQPHADAGALKELFSISLIFYRTLSSLRKYTYKWNKDACCWLTVMLLADNILYTLI